MATYTACYTRIEAGYMGQLLEWPEVITEGGTLEECRAMPIDAAQEMTRAYLETGQVQSGHEAPAGPQSRSEGYPALFSFCSFWP
mgnify:CR=1 FL=1